MSSRYRILYHRDAEQDLLKIYDLIADFTEQQVAQRKLLEIEAALKALSDFPYRGSIRTGYPENFRVVPASEKAVLCITIHDDIKTVIVRLVGYGGSDWTRSVQKRPL